MPVGLFVDDWEAYRHLYFALLGFRLSDFVDGGANQDVELTFLHCTPATTPTPSVTSMAWRPGSDT